VITIVDYKAGNLTSVRLALEHLGVEVEVTDQPDRVAAAEKVIFPGVGAAGAAMDTLRELGLLDALRDRIASGVPFLGICIGMQLLLDCSEEDGGAECMGVLSGKVRLFQPSNSADKVPQMGWNAVEFVKPHPVQRGIDNGSEFYFVHSYYPDPVDDPVVVGRTEYAGVRFASMVATGGLVATQFHPERSGRIGLQLLDNFCQWDGTC